MNLELAIETQDQFVTTIDVPQEIIHLILSNFSDVKDVLRLQTISKAARKVLWRSVVQFKTSDFRESAQQDAKSLLTRLDPNILQELHVTGSYCTMGELSELLQKYVNLRKIEFKSPIDYQNGPYQLVTDISSHKTLEEVEIIGDWPEKDDLMVQILPYVRVVEKDSDPTTKIYRIALDHANYNVVATDHGVFNIQASIQMASSSQLLRGCCVGSKIILGFDDGTLSFYDLDTKNMKLEQIMTSTLHSGPITHIWCDPVFTHPANERDDIVIASADRMVSHWRSNGLKVQLQKRILLPEPINHVFYSHNEDSLLAASKHSVYYCLGDQIIDQVEGIEAEITGIFHSNTCYHISTKTGCYSAFGQYQFGDFNCFNEPTADPHPNMCITPDGSIKGIVTKSEISFKMATDNIHLNSLNGNFDDRPHLQAYSPTEYWFAASTGPSISVYHLESKEEIARFAPHIPKKEMIAGNFPTCRTFWFDEGGHNLFGVYSDNKLYWWNIQKGPQTACQFEL